MITKKNPSRSILIGILATTAAAVLLAAGLNDSIGRNPAQAQGQEMKTS